MFKIKFSLVQLFLLLCLINSLYTQTDSSQKNWSATVIGGVFIPIDHVTYYNSVNSGLEISYSCIPAISVYMNCSYNFLRKSKYSIYRAATSLFEATMGTRFYPNPEIHGIFIDIGFGYYQRIYNRWQYEYTDELGINGGIGTEIKVSNNISIPVEGKIHIIDFLVNGDHMIYSGVYSGIKYSF